MANAVSQEQKLSCNDCETVLMNYRLCFDGMRAYHQSEIEHKKDLLSVLNGVLFSFIPVFAGAFCLLFSKDYTHLFEKRGLVFYVVVSLVIFGIAVIYHFVVSELRRVHSNKVKADNDRYEKYRNECLVCRDCLGLDKLIAAGNTDGHALYWEKRPPKSEDQDAERKGTGYVLTLGILGVYASAIIVVAYILSAFSVCLLFAGYLTREG